MELALWIGIRNRVYKRMRPVGQYLRHKAPVDIQSLHVQASLMGSKAQPFRRPQSGVHPMQKGLEKDRYIEVNTCWHKAHFRSAPARMPCGAHARAPASPTEPSRETHDNAAISCAPASGSSPPSERRPCCRGPPGCPTTGRSRSAPPAASLLPAGRRRIRALHSHPLDPGFHAR